MVAVVGEELAGTAVATLSGGRAELVAEFEQDIQSCARV